MLLDVFPARLVEPRKQVPRDHKHADLLEGALRHLLRLVGAQNGGVFVGKVEPVVCSLLPLGKRGRWHRHNCSGPTANAQLHRRHDLEEGGRLPRSRIMGQNHVLRTTHARHRTRLSLVLVRKQSFAAHIRIGKDAWDVALASRVQTLLQTTRVPRRLCLSLRVGTTFALLFNLLVVLLQFAFWFLVGISIVCLAGTCARSLAKCHRSPRKSSGSTLRRSQFRVCHHTRRGRRRRSHAVARVKGGHSFPVSECLLFHLVQIFVPRTPAILQDSPLRERVCNNKNSLLDFYQICRSCGSASRFTHKSHT